jgi:hypothetical protein
VGLEGLLNETIVNTHKMASENMELSEKLKNQCVENDKTSQETLSLVEKMLEGATRIGLANSFKTRKDEVTKSQSNWGWIFALSAIGLVALIFGTQWLFPVDFKSPISFLNIIPRVLLASPLVWLAWFASRQYSLQDAIKEDYAFKYALSMAYDGYKKAIESASDDDNPELTNKLLSCMLDALSHNPRVLFSEKRISASPVEDILDSKKIKANLNIKEGLSAEISEEKSNSNDDE